MALMTCHECKKPVSTQAKRCPSCGAKVDRPWSIPQRIFAWAFTLSVVTCSVINYKPPAEKEPAKPPTPPLSKEEIQARKDAEDLFQAQVNRARAAVGSIKASALNPDELELNSVGITIKGALCIEYRGRNAFNAKIRGAAVLPPNATKLTIGTPESVANTWNAHCGGKSVTELKNAL